MKDQKHFLTYLSIFILWLFTISAISGVYIGEKEWFMTKTPLNLLLILGLMILVFPIRTMREASLFVFIAIIGIFAEWLGVNYGLIFGNYEYGPNFGPKIGGVPYLIGVNWAFLSFATGSIAGKWFNNLWWKVLAGATLMLVLDIFMERSAPLFDFWYWDSGKPPLKNFIGWFGLAVLFQLLYHQLKIKGNTTFSYHLYATQLLFFIFFYFYFA